MPENILSIPIMDPIRLYFRHWTHSHNTQQLFSTNKFKNWGY